MEMIKTGTEVAMSKAESSRVQFRELFALHEPALLKFSDSMLEAFGRGSIAKVTIYCPLTKETK